jgi:hypothetical protein
MNLKVRCCCTFNKGPVRFIEVEPVIPIPASAEILDEVSWWLDLEETVEYSPDLLLYPGGSASNFGFPFTVGDDPVIVWSTDTPRIWWPNNEIRANNNLADIFSLRHRGWRIKEDGRTADYEGLLDVGGTRIVWVRPGGSIEDPIEQLNAGGFFFFKEVFAQTPAITASRTPPGSTDPYLVGYNPRKECCKPEQARYYGSGEHPKLLFDFTEQFPAEITMKFTYRFFLRNNSDGLQTYEVENTYGKFVGGGLTLPTVQNVFGFQKGVTGFDTEDPEDSDFIKFGYRAIRTDVISDGGALSSDRLVAAPSIPFYYVSAGKKDLGSNGDLAAGESENGSSSSLPGFPASVTTDQVAASQLFPHKIEAGDILQDVIHCPGLGVPDPVPTLGNKNIVARILAPTTPTPDPNGTSTRGAFTSGSYKGASALELNYCWSLVSAYVGADDGITEGTEPTNSTLGGVGNPRPVGTTVFPFFVWDENANLNLDGFTNPLDGSYHFMTEGLPNDVSITEFQNPIQGIPDLRGFPFPLEVTLA